MWFQSQATFLLYCLVSPRWSMGCFSPVQEILPLRWKWFDSLCCGVEGWWSVLGRQKAWPQVWVSGCCAGWTVGWRLRTLGQRLPRPGLAERAKTRNFLGTNYQITPGIWAVDGIYKGKYRYKPFKVSMKRWLFKFISKRNYYISTHLDNLRSLQQTEFRGLAGALWRNPRAGRPGRAEKRAMGLAGGVNHQIHEPGSHCRWRRNGKHKLKTLTQHNCCAFM